MMGGRAMDTKKLAALAAAVRLGSFTRAAELEPGNRGYEANREAARRAAEAERGRIDRR